LDLLAQRISCMNYEVTDLTAGNEFM